MKVCVDDEKTFKKKYFCEKLFVQHHSSMTSITSNDDVEEKFFKMTRVECVFIVDASCEQSCKLHRDTR